MYASPLLTGRPGFPSLPGYPGLPGFPYNNCIKFNIITLQNECDNEMYIVNITTCINNTFVPYGTYLQHFP